MVFRDVGLTDSLGQWLLLANRKQSRPRNYTEKV
jgi:hypothetical protein